MRDEERQRNIYRLTQAIEEDSKAIARLLEACGPSKAFEVEQAALFEELIEHRQLLLALLQEQRGAIRQTDEMGIDRIEQPEAKRQWD